MQPTASKLFSNNNYNLCTEKIILLLLLGCTSINRPLSYHLLFQGISLIQTKEQTNIDACIVAGLLTKSVIDTCTSKFLQFDK